GGSRFCNGAPAGRRRRRSHPRAQDRPSHWQGRGSGYSLPEFFFIRRNDEEPGGQREGQRYRIGKDLEGAQFHRRPFGRGTFARKGGEGGEHERQLFQREIQRSYRNYLREIRGADPLRKSRGALARNRPAGERDRIRLRLSIALAIQSRLQEVRRKIADRISHGAAGESEIEGARWMKSVWD